MPSGPKTTSPEAWLPNWKQPLVSSGSSLPGTITQPLGPSWAVTRLTCIIAGQPARGGSVVAGAGHWS